MTKEIIGLTPKTAKTVKELIRAMGDGGTETLPGQDARWMNNRVALCQAISLRTLSSTSQASRHTIWTANVVLYDATQNISVIGTAYLYDPEDRIVKNKVYLAIETAPDEIDGTPIFVTSTAADDWLTPNSSASNGAGTKIVTDVSCDSGGLAVTFGTLTATVYIGGQPYPVTFTVGGGSGH